ASAMALGCKSAIEKRTSDIIQNARHVPWWEKSRLSATEIDAPAMANAANLIQHYLSESLRLRDLATTNPHLILCQRVLDWLQDRWTEPAIYPAVIYNDCTIREVRDRKTALRVIATLEEHNWLHRLDKHELVQGKARKEAWLIHGRTLS
ncbi:MAG: hypothetical protein NXI02_33510, partial [Rhodobacteraceae bacterium]|nr:hypothetical protein [Paracoccaceae bacterium]